MKKCDAIVGFLVPRRSCERGADTVCAKCKTPICHVHAHIETAGALCPACYRAPALQNFKLAEDVYFSEQDLLDFAEQHQHQARAQGSWIDFT